MEFVSNQEFTDTEYNKWIEATTAASLPMPTQDQVKEKQSDIKEAINYEFNEQDIERIVSLFGMQKVNYITLMIIGTRKGAF